MECNEYKFCLLFSMMNQQKQITFDFDVMIEKNFNQPANHKDKLMKIIDFR